MKEESLKLTRGQAFSRLLFQRHVKPLLGSFSKLAIRIFQILIASHYLYLNYRTTVIILMVLYSFLIGVYSLQIFVDCYFSLLVIMTAGQMSKKFFAKICWAPYPTFLSHGEFCRLLHLGEKNCFFNNILPYMLKLSAFSPVLCVTLTHYCACFFP